MFLSVAVLLLAQAPAPEPVRLGAVAFTAVRVAPELTTSFQETFALRLAETGLVRVTTPRDVASLLGAERQRALLGCAEGATSCLAELAGALGVEGLVTGEVALVGSTYQLTLKILSARDARVLFQRLERFKTEEAVLEALDVAAREGARQVFTALRGVQPKTESSQSSASAAPWVVLGLGAGVAVAGGVLQGLAAADHQRLSTAGAGLTQQQAAQLQSGGELKQTLGITMLSVGGAAAIGGLIWGLVAKPPAQVSGWVTGEGGGLVVGGQW